ncbi:MAG TPA: glycosyltransferase [Acidimicrobiales bacterium]|nr:glycosyltransferase [Acidimicrobiales bacterium]
MPELAVSVVCSTYQRAARLRSLLEALEAQTLDKDLFEVVIVANGCTDDTAAVLDEFATHGSIDLRPVTLGVNRGASGGRNAGWRAARAPFVAFTDDDCAPSPEWLEAGLAAAAETGAAIVVGRTQPNPAQAQNEGVWSRTQTVTSRLGTTFFNTCNIFYRRADLEAVGGLDEEFRTKGGEDTDLGWSIEALGAKAVFAERALVFHDISKGSFRAALREASTWVDIPRVKKKHRARVRPVLHHGVFWKPSHEYVLIALASIGAGAVVRNPIPLAGVLPWVYYRLRKNPVWRRDKAKRIAHLPHAFVLDTVEMTTMVRGSVRHKTLVL